MGSIVPFQKDWRSGLHQRRPTPATTAKLPHRRVVVFELDETLDARLNGEDREPDVRTRLETDVAQVNKAIRRASRKRRTVEARRRRNLKKGM